MSLLTGKNSHRAVLAISLLALFLPVIWIELTLFQYTHGTIAYPLDDTFIHMAVAKNLAFEKVWGISKFSFQSASSSPLYTVLLAGSFLLFGMHLIIPLLINAAAAIIFLVALQKWLIQQGFDAKSQLVILLLVIFLTPLPVLVICGMEHTLQLLFCFLFIYSFSRYASEGRLPWSVFIYGLLMVTTRYETMAIVGIACLLLLRRKQWWTAITLGSVSLLPIVIFGLIAMSKGSYFMPNSVLIKSTAPPLTIDGLTDFIVSTFWMKLFYAARDINFLSASRLLLLLPITYLFFEDNVRQNTEYRYIITILLGAAFAHVSFAFNMPFLFPRYEAYLIGCSVVIILALAIRNGQKMFVSRIQGMEWASLIVFGILAMPLVFRTVYTLSSVKQECINIYDQQYQMAKFVHTYYDKYPIALNDIGAVSYYSDGDKLDLVGIASLDVVKSKKLGYWSNSFADSLARRNGIKLAIVYDSWFDKDLLRRWNKVATWQIQNNVICGDAVVSFYTLDPAYIMKLKQDLLSFQRELPAGVVAKYF